ncbi:MAG: phosphatase [Mycobacteriales bacterium]
MNTADLREYLVAARIAGPVATSRADNLQAIRHLLLGDATNDGWLGVRPARDYSFYDVLRIVSDRTGIIADPAVTEGPDRIDPDLTLEAVELVGRRLAQAARGRERVFAGTGHPIGVSAIFGPALAALRRAGCTVLTPQLGLRVECDGGGRTLRYVDGVALLSRHGFVRHSHSPLPMEALLGAGLAPDLVIGDHGWAGAAATAGLDVVAFADSNDPALFVAADEGSASVVVPLDDNLRGRTYRPLTERLLAAIAAS